MARVSGSIFRRILFWAHLSAGVVAGIFVFSMSVTGALLAYERQVVDWASKHSAVTATSEKKMLSAEELAQHARQAAPQTPGASLRFGADPSMPVAVTFGRQGSILLDPYSGNVVPDPAAGYRRFFRAVENWHRWLGASPQSPVASLIDYSNLLFLFMVVSGIYIWLPAVWKWRIIRERIWFRPKYLNSKMRDFSWHHIFSFWAVIPLLVIVFSGVVMSFGWANNLLFAAFGETAPQAAGPPGAGPRGGAETRGQGGEARAPTTHASIDELLAAAKAAIPNWQTLSVPLDSKGPAVTVTAELKTSQMRVPRQTVVLNAADGGVIKLSDPQGNAGTPGQRARAWIRFAHTGEQYGVIGQTIAGLASLAACFLVYSGLALAWRRLILPLYRRD